MAKQQKIKVKVDINSLNLALPDTLSKSLIEQNICVDLIKLKKDPDLFYNVFEKNIHSWFRSNTMNNTKIVRFCVDNIDDVKLCKILNDEIYKYINDVIGSKEKKLGKKISSILNKYHKFLDKDVKSKILRNLILKNNMFYSYARKSLAELAVKMANNDKDIIDVINIFYKVMDKKVFFNATKKLPNNIGNKIIKNITDKTSRFNILFYNKDKILKYNDKKIQLLKEIARRPSGIKDLNFILNVRIEDLEKLPPGMRFKFLKLYFEDMAHKAGSYYYAPEAFTFKHKHKIRIEDISAEQMSRLLFSVGLKNNTKVSGFIKRFKILKLIQKKKSVNKNMITDAFGFVPTLYNKYQREYHKWLY